MRSIATILEDLWLDRVSKRETVRLSAENHSVLESGVNLIATAKNVQFLKFGVLILPHQN